MAARADQREKLERLCRTISRLAVSQARLSLTPGGHVRCQLKTPYRDGTTHVLFEPLDFLARLAALVLNRGDAHPRLHRGSGVIEKILAHLDAKEAAAQAPRPPPCRGPPEAGSRGEPAGAAQVA